MAVIIEQLVLYIYRLPVTQLMICGVLAAVVFCHLCRVYAGRRWMRPCLGAVLALWFGGVLWTTLLSRDGGQFEANWVPLHTYWIVLCGGERELLRSAFMNAALFYPAGLLCAGLSRGRFRGGMCCTVVLLALFSLSIELSQGFWQLGNAEIDDVIHNTLGAAAGFAAFHLKWIDRPPTKNECEKKEYQP